MQSEAKQDINNTLEVPSDWSHVDELAIAKELGVEETVKHKSIFLPFLIVGVVTLLLAIGFAYYQYEFSKNQVSSDKILITTDIKENLRAGESNLINLSLNNSNMMDLSNVELKITYQRGFTRQGEADIVTSVFYFGDLKPAIYYSTSTFISLVGNENDVRKFKIDMKYKVQGSNAEFNKSYESNIRISNPSLSLKIESSDNVLEENEITYKFKVKNLSLDSFQRSALVIEVPPAFVIKRNPEIEDQKKIIIETLKVGEEKEYSITGYYKASIGETKILRSYVAVTNSTDDPGSAYAEDVKEIVVRSYPLTYKYKLKSNNSEGSYFEVGKENILEFELTNITDDAVSDVTMLIQNELTKDVISVDGKQISSLIKVTPSEPSIIPVSIMNSFVGTYDYKLEIFGKLRGMSDTVLLSKGILNIKFKNADQY